MVANNCSDDEDSASSDKLEDNDNKDAGVVDEDNDIDLDFGDLPPLGDGIMNDTK